METKIDTKLVGDIVQVPLEQFNELIKNYKELKLACQEKDKALEYLNEEIRQYNKIKEA